jgi:hypothetical protein
MGIGFALVILGSVLATRRPRAAAVERQLAAEPGTESTTSPA